MFGKGSKLYSIFNLKCPACHEGEMFETGSYSFKNPFEMRQRCAKCDLNFFPEPGFYYGSMFISYIWTGWFSLLFVMLFHWKLGYSIDFSFGMLIVFMAVNFVYIFRISRLMWINFHVKYNPEAVKKLNN
jgi:hypothetical protein